MRVWNKTEDAIAVQMIQNGVLFLEIAERLGRTENAIRGRFEHRVNLLGSSFEKRAFLTEFSPCIKGGLEV